MTELFDKLTSGEGRMGRKEYAILHFSTLTALILSAAACLVTKLAVILVIPMYLVSLLVVVQIARKRIRDFSGHRLLFLTLFLPIINIPVMLFLFFKKSSVQEAPKQFTSKAA